MFELTSRYFDIATVKMELTDRNGQARVIAYKKRRFIPSVEGTVTIVEHLVAEGDRLDNIAARYLGDPLQFWRICDANPLLLPDELTDEPGDAIRIALPKL